MTEHWCVNWQSEALRAEQPEEDYDPTEAETSKAFSTKEQAVAKARLLLSDPDAKNDPISVTHERMGADGYWRVVEICEEWFPGR